MDRATRSTAGESFIAKLSAVKAKYFDDLFIDSYELQRYLTKNNIITGIGKRSPGINRGYYARVRCKRDATRKFFSSLSEEESNCQIVILGCGFDTEPLNILQQYDVNDRRVCIYEVDFPETILSKEAIYQSDAKMRAFLSNERYQNNNPIQLISADLRQPESLLQQLSGRSFDPNRPTLVITECVLVYMNKGESNSLLDALSSTLTHPRSTWISYDMFQPNDPYGQQMLQNLRQSGFHIPGLQDFPTTEDHCDRFRRCGWTAAAMSMKQYYYRNTSLEEQKRIMKLEILDEVEEWNMLMDHYCFTVAIKIPSDDIFAEGLAGYLK